MQWNVRGVTSAKQELIKLIDTYNPIVLAIQETFLGNEFMVKLPGFAGFCKQGHYNNRFHGGVAIYIHNSCPYQKIEIQSEHQIVAASIQLDHHEPISIASIYIPGREKMTRQSLKNILEQLPKPFLLLGDLNGHHAMWGSASNDQRGNLIVDLLNDLHLNCLNDGRPTHESGSCIDLSICDSPLSLSLDWNVLESVLTSDHCPVLVSLITRSTDNTRQQTRYNMKKAKWIEYTTDPVWNENPPDAAVNDCSSLIEDMYTRIYAASDRHIPKV